MRTRARGRRVGENMSHGTWDDSRKYLLCKLSAHVGPAPDTYDSVDIWHRLCLPLRHVVLRLGLSVAVQLIGLGLRLLLVD